MITHKLRNSLLSDELFQNMVEEARDIIIVSDINGKIIYANSAALDANGYSGDELYTLSINNFRPQETKQELDFQMKEACNKGLLHRTVNLRKNGELFHIEVSFQRINLDVKDFLTEGHSDRLQNSMQAFASIVGVPESSTADFKLFAHFHDIGKVGIPDSILFKPGALTVEEWKIMRRHCELGYNIAKSTPDFEPIADLILMHHEWWNGQGYALGLKEKDIPLACRMLTIVDAYDAMTNDRPYRKRMSHVAASAEIRRCAGTQFDPVLVDKYITMLNNKQIS